MSSATSTLTPSGTEPDADTEATADSEHEREPEQEKAPPHVGVLMKRGRQVGRVMACQFGVVYLRPDGGGKEWTAKPGELEPVSVREALSPRVREANKRSRGEL